MRLSEILQEDVSSEASLKNIDDILTVQLPGLYRGMKLMAEKYANNYTPKREDGVYEYDPEKFMKSLTFIMGSQKAKWYQDVFFKALKPALYNFSKSLPPVLRNRLSQSLSDMVISGSMKNVEGSLIQQLDNIALVTKNARLKSAVTTAKDAIREYNLHIEKMEPIAARNNAPIDSGYDDPAPPKERSSIGSQNASVESIISDVLSRIDKKQAGDIRNAIARSANKLQALQIELNRRGIKV